MKTPLKFYLFLTVAIIAICAKTGKADNYNYQPISDNNLDNCIVNENGTLMLCDDYNPPQQACCKFVITNPNNLKAKLVNSCPECKIVTVDYIDYSGRGTRETTVDYTVKGNSFLEIRSGSYKTTILAEKPCK